MGPSFHGLLVIDKPAGLTSRAVVDRVQSWFPRGTRIGHTGTLDPLATGVLVACIGVATRLAEYVQAMSKTYRAGIFLGARSDTDDADGQVTAVADANLPTRAELDRALAGFIGEIEQVPPRFSAAKVTGQRAYALARRGREVALTARRVQIDRIDVLDYAFQHLDLEVACGKGTYIRSLARDLGETLGCGGHIATLRRTRVGPFLAEHGLDVSAISAMEAQARLLPITHAVAELPRVIVSQPEAMALRHGQAIPFKEEPFANLKSPVALFEETERLVGVGRIDRGKGVIRAEKIMAIED